MYRWLRPLVFWLPPELAHGIGLWLIRLLGSVGLVRRRVRKRMLPDLPELQSERFGLTFPSPLGVAAGLDKDGSATAGLFALGFGFVEVGTLTPRPQPGNPKPRLFRAPGDESLVNRMGFNNHGATAAAARLKDVYRPGPLGLNLGKNKVTAEGDAIEDYLSAGRAVCGVADYLVVNVSSPNTPGLRDLQRPDRLLPLLVRVRESFDRPLLLKFSPDLEEPALLDLLEVAQSVPVAGLIATNTTTWRPTAGVGPYAEAGGLSGALLAPLARRSLQLAFRRLGRTIPLVGVGGLRTPEDLLERLEDGAALLQAYTGFVFGGPGWASAVTLGLARLLRRKGYRCIDDAVGRRAA